MDNETEIKIRIADDPAGAAKVNRTVAGIGETAKRSLGEAEKSAKNATNAIRGMRRASRLLTGVLTGFGFAGVFSALAGAVGKVRESFQAAKKEAEAFGKAADLAAHREAIDALAKSYAALGEAAKASAEALRHQNEMQDISVKNARELEDAQLELAEQQELAAVDANDPAAGEARAQIAARYAAKRGNLAVSRGKEDVAYQMQGLQAEADRKRAEADAREGAAGETDKAIGDLRRQLADALARSVSQNGADAQGAPSFFLGNVKNLLTGNWGRIGDSRTEAGDAERQEAAAEAERLKEEIKQLEAQRDAARKAAEDLRTGAGRDEERREALGGQLAAIDVREQAAFAGGRNAVSAADHARARKEKQVAADLKTVGEAPGQIAGLEAQGAAEQARAQAAADRYAAEQGDVFAAQGRYDMLVANGGSRKDRSAALAALQREQGEAQEAKHEMEQVAAQVAATLKDITAQIKALSSAVKQAENRLGQNQADAPEG